jgi:hypothetical protein
MITSPFFLEFPALRVPPAAPFFDCLFSRVRRTRRLEI